jgi:hypothetical protein
MRSITVGVVLGLAVASASAAYTGALTGFQADLTAASAGLSGLTDPVSVQQKKAVDRSIAAVLAYSTSLGKDLSTAGKIARLLEKPFPPEAPLLATFDGTLDGLETEVLGVRDLLANETQLLSGPKRSAAESALASVDGSLVLAGVSSTRTLRAGLLKKAEHRASAARRSLRKGARAGFQGPVNGSFEQLGGNANAAYWSPTTNFPAVIGNVTSGTIPDGLHHVWFFFPVRGDTVPITASLSQSGVLLSRTRRILFDYSATVTVGLCTGGPDVGQKGTMKLEVLFLMEDPAVTVVLWTRDFPAGQTSETVANQAVDLPFLPSAGSLIFRVTANWVSCRAGPSNPAQGFVSFGSVYIDHVRVD